jgi:hypothetical protein
VENFTNLKEKDEYGFKEREWELGILFELFIN